MYSVASIDTHPLIDKASLVKVLNCLLHGHVENSVENENEPLAVRINAAETLWDLCMVPDHVRFLVENRVIDVLGCVMDMQSQSTDPQKHRLIEVCLGTIANVLTVEDMARQDPSLIFTQIIRVIASSEDPPSLSEAFRCLESALSHRTAQLPWLQFLCEDDILLHALSIASNALNPQLLLRCVRFFHRLFMGPDDDDSSDPGERQHSPVEYTLDAGCGHGASPADVSLNSEEVMGKRSRIEVAATTMTENSTDEYEEDVTRDGSARAVRVDGVVLSPTEKSATSGLDTCTETHAKLRTQILERLSDLAFYRCIRELSCEYLSPGQYDIPQNAELVDAILDLLEVLSLREDWALHLLNSRGDAAPHSPHEETQAGIQNTCDAEGAPQFIVVLQKAASEGLSDPSVAFPCLSVLANLAAQVQRAIKDPSRSSKVCELRPDPLHLGETLSEAVPLLEFAVEGLRSICAEGCTELERAEVLVAFLSVVCHAKTERGVSFLKRHVTCLQRCASQLHDVDDDVASMLTTIIRYITGVS
eukprot:Rmarinus@m.13965